MITHRASRWYLRALCGALFALLLGLIGLSFAHPAPAAADDPAVSIQGFAFNAAVTTIPTGATLTWTNNDTTEHCTTSDTGVWDSGKIVPGASFSYTFMTPGTYTYHCKYHIFMTGTVIVMDSGASAPAAVPTDAGTTPTAGP